MSASTIVPVDVLQGSPLDSVKINRVPIRNQSDTSSYSYGGKVEFTLPNDFVDLRDSYLTFFAQANLGGGGSTYVRFTYPIQTIFTRAQVYLGSELVEDITNYNVLAGIFTLASSIDAVERSTMEGNYDTVNRGIDTTTGRYYSVALRMEMLQRVVPLHKLRLPLRIRLFIGDATEILEHDGSAPTSITFNSAYFNYHSLQVPSEVDALLDAQIAAGKSQIRIHTYENFNQATGAGASVTVLLPFKHKVVNALLGVFRQQSQINNPATNNRYIDRFLATQNLISSNAKVGVQIYPADKYDMAGATSQGIVMLQRPFNNIMYQDFRAHDRQQETFMGELPAQRICVPIDLRRDNGPNSMNLWDNGIDTSTSATSSQFSFNFAGSATALSVDVFCRYEVVVNILPGGGISLQQ